jgi:hypothetical protein
LLLTARGRALAVVLSLLAAAAFAGCGGSSEQPQNADAGTGPATEQAPAESGAETNPSEPAAPAEEAAAEPQPEFRPETATGAVPGTPAPTNTAPIVAVANYFTELPGIDIAALKPKQKERFLQHVNSEMCPCGCKNDTLARCYVNDPRCPVVKGMVQKVYDEVKAAR